MKLQNLAIIFAVIVIPITLILGAYIGMQIDTIKLQIKYDEKLSDAVYDAIKAYQINTANNPYAIINSSQRRDIEAAINTFMNSFATGLGVSGYGENYIKPYVPAILCALYDGYYIYAPTENQKSGEIEHLIKPYVTYSQRYKHGSTDVVVSYTLDNYITVTGMFGSEYENRAGYLINEDISEDVKNTETLTETLAITFGQPKTYKYIYRGGEKTYYDDETGKWFLYRNGARVTINMDSSIQPYDTNAMTYSKESKEFTAWVKEKLGDIALEDLVLEDSIKDRNQNHIYWGNNGKDKIFNPDNNDFESESSTFNIHKRDMIRISIKENLSSAIANYSKHSGALDTNYAFQMPILEEAEWDQITKNICMVAFVQGLPVGFKTYNNYAIINNTRNKNYVDQDSLCFINSDTSTYHRIDCDKLGEANIQGYRQIDFEGNNEELKYTYGEVSYDPITGTWVQKEEQITDDVYNYKHNNLPCYYCIVSRNYDKVDITGNRLTALRYALARERQMLHY